MKQLSFRTEQATAFSHSPLKGFYRYKELFQILPHKKQNESFQHDHPLIIEISFDEEVYPERSDATSQNNWRGNLTLLTLRNFSCEIPLHPALRGISQEKFSRLSESS